MKAFIGIDIGGTFTDAVFLVDGKLRVYKTLTTHQDPARGVLTALEGLPRQTFTLTHGSTLATNAVLERRGAKTAFITTRHFEDLLRIARQNRRELYNLHPTEPTPLVPEKYTFGITERIDHSGGILEPLDTASAREIFEKIREEGIESVAVCLLFSFRNDSHEKTLRQICGDFPGFLSLSSEVLPEYREYERASTTLLNAYVSPILDRYITRLDEELRQRGAKDFKIMESGGGIIPAVEAGRFGVRTILSGPAGGVAGAFGIASASGITSIITLDMGGTSTDVSLCSGSIGETREGNIEGIPIRIPMVDIVTIGAGGGSIAYPDPGGVLKVGSRSAGSDPGPAAFGKGTEPTVTDAHLVLGTLAPGDFLDGTFPVDKNRSQDAIGRIADTLSISPEEAAAGIIRITLSHMERALRMVSLERGYDPTSFTLVPFGGAGPLHAPFLASALGIKRILIPAYPGVLSALGMLLCDFRMDFSRTVLTPIRQLTRKTYEETVAGLYNRITEFLNRNYFNRAHLEFIFDVRYRGQSFELSLRGETRECIGTNTGFQLPPVPEFDAEKLQKEFHREHEKRYGFSRQEETVELVNLRIDLAGTGNTLKFPKKPEKEGVPLPETSEIRKITLPDNSSVSAPVYRRETLPPGTKLQGPAVVKQYDTITLIPPKWKGHIDGYENLILEIEG